MEFYKCQEKKDVYSTWCSQAVTHLSTNHARRCLTSVIGREPVFSTWYGRKHLIPIDQTIYMGKQNKKNHRFSMKFYIFSSKNGRKFVEN